MDKKENITGLGSNHKYGTPFTVPHGYFEELPQRVQEYCLAHGEIRNVKKVTPWQVIKTQLALVSGFVILVFFAFTGYYFLKPKSEVELNMVSNDHFFEIIQTDVCFFETDNADNTFWYRDTIKTKQNDEVIHYMQKQNIYFTTLSE